MMMVLSRSPTRRNRNFGADVTPFKIIRGGVEVREYASLRKASFFYDDFFVTGDVVKVAAGDYSPADSLAPGALGAPLDVATLVVEWLTPGSRPYIDMSTVVQLNIDAGGELAALTMEAHCTDLTVTGIRAKGVRNPYTTNTNFITGISGYGLSDRESYSAIPYTLTVEGCEFIKFTNGILIGPNWNGEIELHSNVMTDCSAGDQSHGTYIGTIASILARGNKYQRTADGAVGVPQSSAGHLFKTRARVGTIQANVFDSTGGGQARSIDICNGGEYEITGNVFLHGDSDVSQSANQTISFGPEQSIIWSGYQADGRTHSLTVAQNTFKDYQRFGLPFIKLWDIPTLLLSARETGTAQAATSTSITLAVAVNITSSLHQSVIVITSGTGSGSHGFISGWDNTTKVAQICGGWSGTAPTAGSGYKLISSPVIESTLVETGHCQAATATSITLDSGSTATPAVGDIINAPSGFELSQVGYVTAWNAGTKVATIAGGWSQGSTPIAGDAYRLFSKPSAATITVTVKDNIVASQVNTATLGAQGFIASYPDNTQVGMSDLDSDGRLLISDIPGSGNSAPYAFSDDFESPDVRTDSYMGAYRSGL